MRSKGRPQPSAATDGWTEKHTALCFSVHPCTPVIEGLWLLGLLRLLDGGLRVVRRVKR
jgi:hypothetical protein